MSRDTVAQNMWSHPHLNIIKCMTQYGCNIHKRWGCERVICWWQQSNNDWIFDEKQTVAVCGYFLRFKKLCSQHSRKKNGCRFINKSSNCRHKFKVKKIVSKKFCEGLWTFWFAIHTYSCLECRITKSLFMRIHSKKFNTYVRK